MLTETRGEGVINSLFDGWDLHAGPIERRKNGAIVADRAGKTTSYSLFHLQPRGTLFVNPGTDVYEGMIVGEHIRENDLNVNAVRGKQLTNFRAAGADEKTVIAPPKLHTLEEAMEFIDDDEWVEVTPKTIRLRKRVLASNQRSIVRRDRREIRRIESPRRRRRHAEVAEPVLARDERHLRLRAGAGAHAGL